MILCVSIDIGKLDLEIMSYFFVILQGFEGIWEGKRVVSLLLGSPHGAICECRGI